MASLAKTYFLSPSWDLQPTDVVLGSVFSNVKKPQKVISASSLPEKIDTQISNPVASKNVHGAVKKGGSWALGIFATFIHFITFGASANISSATSRDIEFSCEKIDTRWFTPSSTYLAAAVEDPGVKKYLSFGGKKASVFLVTGVKVARGVIVKTPEQSQTSVHAQVGVEIPAIESTVGPKASWKPENSAQVEQDIPGPGVFAFQVERITVNKQGDARSAEVTKGAVLGVDQAGEEYEVAREAGDLVEDEAEDIGECVVTGHGDDGTTCRIWMPME